MSALPAPGGAPPQSPAAALKTEALRAQIARLERAGVETDWGAAPFGDPRVDSCFPAGGLPRGRWHEIAGDGRESEMPAAASGFAACLAARAARDGAVLWALQRADLYAPGLQAFGLAPDRVIFVQAKKEAEILAIMEDALRTRGIDCVIGEIGAVDLAASRRLQLACERHGATGFLLRRKPYGRAWKEIPRTDITAATTRWRISTAPAATDEPGLGPPRWRARLERCRGGRTGAWIMEMENATGDVRVCAELADHALAAHGAGGNDHRPGRLRDSHEFGKRAALGGGG